MQGAVLMARQANELDLRTFARVGAQARLAEIDRERTAILAAFPDLSARRSAATEASRSAAAKGPSTKRPRRGMSAAARKAVSARMKKYWAGRRKQSASAGK
jgi:hypothetical protein